MEQAIDGSIHDYYTNGCVSVLLSHWNIHWLMLLPCMNSKSCSVFMYVCRHECFRIMCFTCNIVQRSVTICCGCLYTQFNCVNIEVVLSFSLCNHSPSLVPKVSMTWIFRLHRFSWHVYYLCVVISTCKEWWKKTILNRKVVQYKKYR